jgi:hypothetical protein
VTSVDLQVPLILNVGAPQSRLSGMKGVENSRAVEDDMDTATLWTHRTRPQGLEISHRTRAYAARKLDQSAARKVIHLTGGSFYALLI